MSDADVAPAANDSPLPAPQASEPPAELSVNDAVAALRKSREPAPETNNQPATDDGAADEESDAVEAADDAGPDEAPGESEDGDEAGEPPIDPPRTWSKAEKEAFKLLPPEHQRAIVDRENERDTHYQRGLQEAAQKARAAEAREQAAEQARQQYEQALPALYERMYGQFQQEFGDIKTPDDVSRLRNEDPMRWMAYRDAKEQALQVYQEAQQAQVRQAREAEDGWRKFAADEDAAFIEKAPEFKDAKKAATLVAEARTMFSDLGFKPEEIGEMWDGGKKISLRDHRLQLALNDAVKYRLAQKAAKAAKPKPVPPVQRPGTSQNRGQGSEARIGDLTNKLKSGSGSVHDAVALLRASRERAARAS